MKMMQRSDSAKSKKDLEEHQEVDQHGGDRRVNYTATGGTLWTGVAPVDTARLSRDSDLSLGDLYDVHRSAKENKSLLMSYELDRMQMGRYQWFVFGLCGLGYFIDLLWAQALGLIATPLKNEPGFGADSEYDVEPVMRVLRRLTRVSFFVAVRQFHLHAVHRFQRRPDRWCIFVGHPS